MMNQVLQLIELFGAEIGGTETTNCDGKEYIFLDFENRFCWASIAYDKVTKTLITATIEDKERKYYFQLQGPENVFEMDREATLLNSYDDYVINASKIWNNIKTV